MTARKVFSLRRSAARWSWFVAAAAAIGCAEGGAAADETSAPGGPDASSWSVASPDGSLNFRIRKNDAGGFEYAAALDGRSVLGWSALGLETTLTNSRAPDEPIVSDFSATASVVSVETAEIAEDYVMLTGKRRENAARANELRLSLVDDETDRRLRLDVRAFDEGFAFRYVLTEPDILQHWLTSEATSFNVGPDGTHWGQPYDFPTTYQPAYETPWTKGVPTGTSVTGEGTGWGFPSLFETAAGDWLLIHESNVGLQDHGSHLAADAADGVYVVAPPLEESGMGFGRNIAAATPPWPMPWRVGIVGDELADIVESNLAFHVSDPSRIENTDWIKPGLASWSWATDHASSRDLGKLKNFIDLAAEMGWPYSLIDANWNTISDTSMEDLTTYANERGVGLTFWYNSGGRHNVVTEQPRNVMSDPERRRAEFDKLKRLGAKGVKVDFFQSDKQDVMNLYLEILGDAAEREMLVIFHGSTMPRGWARTWPNLMSMESVIGAEFYTFPSDRNYTDLAPYQNAVLPFTRNVIGSMDYTPVIYSPQMIERRTTNGHETALAVVFESGVQHIADSAESLRALPAPYKDFFGRLPAAWDETRFVAGYPGDHVVIARRKGEQWFVGGLNGAGEAKDLSLDLSFVADGALAGTLLHDGETGREFASSRLEADPGEIAITLAPYGGFALIVE